MNEDFLLRNPASSDSEFGNVTCLLCPSEVEWQPPTQGIGRVAFHECRVKSAVKMSPDRGLFWGGDIDGDDSSIALDS